MRIVCNQHVAFEGPAAIAYWAHARGHRIDCIEVFRGASLPAPTDYEMLVIMGGPMNIYQESIHSWLTAEKAMIRDAIQAGKYLVGVCLGSQLIADQLGSPVFRAECAEMGWWPVARTRDCPQAFPCPETLRVFHWHGDTFELPPGARQLIASAGCACQGFLQGDRILGLQCHLEATPASVTALIDACGDEIREGRYSQPASAMRAEPQSTFDAMHEVLFQLLDVLTSHA